MNPSISRWSTPAAARLLVKLWREVWKPTFNQSFRVKDKLVRRLQKLGYTVTVTETVPAG